MSMNRSSTDIENGTAVISPLLGSPRASSQSTITRKLKAAGKFGAQAVIGSITALQNAANAAAAPSDIDPSEISWNWFEGLSSDVKGFTVANATSAELVNAILNLLFLQVAYGILLNLWNRQKTSSKEKVIVAAELLFALDSAVTLAFIAEDSFTFLPYHTNAIPATISFATNFASRLTGIDDAVMRVRNYFQKNSRIQKQLVEALTYFENQAYLESVFNNDHDEFLLANQNNNDELTYNNLLTQFLANLSTHIEADDFRIKTAKDKAKAGAGISFDILMATYIGVCAFLTFMQKGYQGKADIAKFFAHEGSDSSSSSDSLPMAHAYQAMLGVMSGVSSGALYFTRALDFRCMLVDLAEHLIDNRAHPKPFMIAITLAAANYFASSSGLNMAQKIVDMTPPHTAIVPMVRGSAIAKIYEYGNQAGVLEVNTLSTINKAILNPPSKPDDTLTFKAFLRKLRNPTSILITEESLEHAKKIIGAYNERQNQAKQEAATLVKGSRTSFFQQDPESHHSEHSRLSEVNTEITINADPASADTLNKKKPQRKHSQ